MGKRTFVDIRKIASYNALYNGWRLVSTGDGKDERRDVIEFGKNLKANLKDLQRRLLDGTWEPDSGKVFYLETENKIREIHTVGVEDRIVHQTLVYHFALQKRFVNRTFGSIKGRGTLRANKQVRKDLHRSKYKYALKLDVKKYYPSINKTKLIREIRRKYKGEAAIALLEKVIRAYKPELDIGVSIGALTSQNNGNFYLTPFDYFVLEVLGVKYYVRYVDDMVILVPDKKEGERIIRRLIEFLNGYDLVFGKIALFPIDKRRIDFCSYAVNNENVRLRKGILKRFIRKLRDLKKHPQEGMYERSCVCSYLGFLKYCDSNNILKVLKDEYGEVFVRIDRYAKKRRSKEVDASCSTSGTERVQTFLQPQKRRGRPGHNRRGNRGTRHKVCISPGS